MTTLHAVGTGSLVLGVWETTSSWPLAVGVFCLCAWSYFSRGVSA